jgi:hypothetical protein
MSNIACAWARRIFPARSHACKNLRILISELACACVCSNVPARAHVQTCLRVRMLMSACACADKAFMRLRTPKIVLCPHIDYWMHVRMGYGKLPARAHVQTCMRVGSLCFQACGDVKFVCACACKNLYAPAHSRSCLRVRMPNLSELAHAKICMRVRIPDRVCACARRILHGRAHVGYCMCLRDSMFQNI